MPNHRRRAIGHEILTLRSSLQSLDRSLRRLAPILSATLALNGTAKPNDRSRPRLSPKACASLILQCRYMGYMRQLKSRQKAQVRRVREAKEVTAAIRQAQRLARG